MSLNGTLGFLGYGNMGSAILEGLIERDAITGKRVYVYDPMPERRADAERVGATGVDSVEALAQESSTLLLAVKPQMMEEAIAPIRNTVGVGTLIISIAAGISIHYLQERLGDDVPVIRVMPNTPALVQAGAAGIALGDNCTEAHAAVAKTIFSAIGIAEIVKESDMDAVTALSGSGPAYFFYMVECMTKAATEAGLDEAIATRLAAQTLFGAGQLLHASEDSAATLRQKVTSKGGTTEAALDQFREDGFDLLVSAALQAAIQRSRELGA